MRRTAGTSLPGGGGCAAERAVWKFFLPGSVLVSRTVSVQAAVTGDQRWWLRNNKSFFLMVLEAGKVQVRVQKNSVW